MKNWAGLLAILTIVLLNQFSWADLPPGSKEDEKFAQEFLERLRYQRPELFRSGDLLSRKFINAQFSDKYGPGWIQQNFEYHFSSGWLIAKIFTPQQKQNDRSVKYEIYQTSRSVHDYIFEFSGNEKIIAEGSNKYFVKSYEDGEVRRAWITDEMDSNLGKLRVIAKEFSDKTGTGMHSTLALDHKEIFRSGVNHIRLYKVFTIDGEPHVLIGENCGGTGCRFDDLRILIIGGNREVKVIGNDDFYSEDNSITPSTDGRKLVVKLGLCKGKDKTAIYADNKLKIIYETLPYKPLTSRQCALFYKIAGGCIRGASIKRPCEQYAVGFSGRANSDAWDLRYLSNEPGFKQKLFDTECLNACKTERLPDYDKFSTRVCGRKYKYVDPYQ